jgi:hypothetical protein
MSANNCVTAYLREVADHPVGLLAVVPHGFLVVPQSEAGLPGFHSAAPVLTDRNVVACRERGWVVRGRYGERERERERE